ncbi:MAG: DHA2 family efflux MFS transporter permease subunit [Jatrophihabitans sp.]
MRKWMPLIAISLGTFMLLVDVTIVNVALPDMADDLSTSFSSLQWVIDIYALVLAALLLGSGTIADRVGHRRIYVVGLIMFAAASLVSGLAPNSGVLIAARGLQGIGGAAMFATTFALLNSSYTGRDRGVAYGIWGAIGGAAAAVGPIAGGLLTQNFSWRWIFYVNLPISVLAVVMCMMVLTGGDSRRKTRLDLAGMISFTVAAAALTYGLIRANDDGWASAGTLGMVVLAAIALVAFVLVELRAVAPMFDLALLRHGPFVGALVAGLAMNFAAFAYLAYSSVWLQSVLGLGPVKAGVVGALPLAVTAFLTSAIAGRFLHGDKSRAAIGGGLLLIGVGGLVEAYQLHSTADWHALLVGLAISGVGVGLAAPALSSTAMGAVPLQRGGMAAGAVNTARQLGFALGIAVLGSVFAARAQHSLGGASLTDAAGQAKAIAGGQAQQIVAHVPEGSRQHVATVVRAAATSGLQGTVLVAGVCGVVAAVITVGLLGKPQSAKHESPAVDGDLAAAAT